LAGFINEIEDDDVPAHLSEWLKGEPAMEYALSALVA
jgi:hypothetical protein